MTKLSKYLSVFNRSWQHYLQYRGAILFRFAVASISLISVFYLWNDVFSARTAILGYSKEQMMTYYIIVGYLFSSIFAGLNVDEDIRLGTLSIYLTKPISYIGHEYAKTLAKRIFRLLVGLPILIVIFVIFRDHLMLVTDPMCYVYLVVSAFFAINILYLFDFIIQCIEFWVLNSGGVNLFINTIVSFFAGTVIPLTFLPGYIQTVAQYLPFKYTGIFIIDSFLGKLSPMQIFAGLGLQLFWTLILLIIVKIVWWRGLRRYEASGA